jgi:hypothetical protein
VSATAVDEDQAAPTGLSPDKVVNDAASDLDLSVTPRHGDGAPEPVRGIRKDGRNRHDRRSRLLDAADPLATR